MTQNLLSDRILGRRAARAAAVVAAVIAASCLAGAPGPAAAQADPNTGARPGNVIGTGSSLPLGNTA
ncbi:hypothetical protein, partial [Acidisphaera rubrifaciens]|uniref:hypothetical protein n=1 Tax=Acidisphaera rubrifaciens TaxID=50715 RepID=UPI000662298B